jgi:chaperonin GroES
MAAKVKKDMVSYQPTAGYVLVQQLEAQTKTDSGIYLPDNAKDKPQTGKVLEVGPEVVTDSGSIQKPPVKKGDSIIFKKWGGNEVTFSGEEYLFVKFEDILAIER